MNDAERAAVQECWQARESAVVVATNAFKVGIDKPLWRYRQYLPLQAGAA